MRVNSFFTCFFTNRLMVKSGITIVMLFCLSRMSVSAPCDRETPPGRDPDLRAKQVNLIIRQIGHRLLLQAGDSTSRVLPVTEIKEGTFQLQFENEFVFNHDSLMALSQGLLPETEFTSGYTVTVHDCLTASIVYGFQVNSTSPDILACRGRSQPTGCYIIEFTFPDFYENVEQTKADNDQLTKKRKSFKAESQEAIAKLEESKTTTFGNDIDRVTEELKSFEAARQEANTKLEESKTTFDYSLSNLVYSTMLVLLGVTLLIARLGKISTPVPVQNQNHTIVKGSVPELAALGKFLFDVKGQRLLLGNEMISLTDKESKILELLNKSFGELILRETLMQEVWINEGVITGRSLDMFVSKLRKKLSGDPELRITNVHGKGYTLEIPGI